jgi:hypothetical protein
MLSRLKTRPSPALVISLIALFVSLGGAGYAAATVTGKDVKNSSLTGKDVKNSSLTGKDVKNSSLTGSDVKRSSLTGKDVKNGSLAGPDLKANAIGGREIVESQLGKVPSATRADLADLATRAGTAANVDKLKTVGSYKKVISSASNAEPSVARDAATKVPLYSFGPFDVYGKCFTDSDAPATHAEAFIASDTDGSIFRSTISLLGAPAYLDRGSAETTRLISSTNAGANDAKGSPTFPDEFFAAAPTGTGINGVVTVVAKNGTLAAGNGLYGNGNACLFSGHVIG